MIEGSIGYPPATIAVFCAGIIGFIILDLFVHRGDRPVSLFDAILWSLVWIAASLAFFGYIHWQYGAERANLFLAGYLLEKVLSVDNLMVFLAIFSAFSIPEAYRHRILYYGVIGAILFRLVFVMIGTSIYALGPWVEFLFAAVITWTAVKMLQQKHDDEELEDYAHHWSVRLTERLVPVFPKLVGHNFFVGPKVLAAELEKPENAGLQLARQAKLYATPLLLCLVCVEFADIVFAFDSVPAIIAVTKDPLLVYSAMIFAILGLRSLYFVLAAMQRYLAHLGKAVIALLFFIAFKLCVNAANHMFGWPDFEIDPNLSLIVVVCVLTAGVIASFVFPSAVTRRKASGRP
ncbi:MAG: TerC/Alx family metal homeostasis membrane protein [Azospirillum sp.]|nr:TerC/Alx family metal homeostasis membrane protein [Azospirillum sp.]